MPSIGLSRVHQDELYLNTPFGVAAVYEADHEVPQSMCVDVLSLVGRQSHNLLACAETEQEWRKTRTEAPEDAMSNPDCR